MILGKFRQLFSEPAKALLVRQSHVAEEASLFLVQSVVDSKTLLFLLMASLYLQVPLDNVSGVLLLVLSGLLIELGWFEGFLALAFLLVLDSQQVRKTDSLQFG